MKHLLACAAIVASVGLAANVANAETTIVKTQTPTAVTTTTSTVTTESLQKLEGQTKFLQDGTHARVRGDRLIVLDANNTESPASEGTQTLQDGTVVDIGPGGVIRSMTPAE